MVDLKEKVEKMPSIETKTKVITAKASGKKFLVVETIITNFVSLDYVQVLEQSDSNKAGMKKSAAKDDRDELFA